MIPYFQGHPDAAVKLQRDWLIDPQTLPFAQHIKTHALVSLIQKGLQYYQIEQSLDPVSHNTPVNNDLFSKVPSPAVENLHHQLLYYFSVLKPVAHHL